MESRSRHTRTSLLRQRDHEPRADMSIWRLIGSASGVAVVLYALWLIFTEPVGDIGARSIGDAVVTVVLPALLVVVPITTIGYGINKLVDRTIGDVGPGSERIIRTGLWLISGVVGSIVGIEAVTILNRGGLGLDSSLLAYTVTANVVVLVGVSVMGAVVSSRRRGRMLHRQTRLLTDEFRTAYDVQQGLLPQERPHLPGFDISGTMRPAVEIGGDYFDYLSFADGTKGIIVADASGKGVPAALIMAKFQGMAQALSIYAPSVREFFSALNDALRVRLDRGRFITAGLISIDLDDRSEFWRAGHNTLLHFTSDNGSVEEYQPGGMALGLTDGPILDAALYPEQFGFAPGDVLLLASDGLTESPNDRGEQYGEVRLRDAFRTASLKNDSSDLIRDAILEDLSRFRGSLIEHDDVTLVIVRRQMVQ